MKAQTKNGFTLIEMMVTLTILIVISGLSVAGVIVFNQQQGIDDDTKALVSELRRVYSKATGIYYPAGCTSLTGYQVIVPSPTGSSNMRVVALCSSGNIAEERNGVLKNSYFPNKEQIAFTIAAGSGRIAGAPYTLSITSSTNANISSGVQINDLGIVEIVEIVNSGSELGGSGGDTQ